MKISLIAGVLLAACGLVLILHPPHYATHQQLFKFGGVEASVRQEQPIPGWIGGTALGAGIVLLGIALFRKR